MLKENPHRHAAPARIQDRLGNDIRIELLDRDVQRCLSLFYEFEDHLFEIVGGTQLGRPNEGLNLAAGEVRHCLSRSKEAAWHKLPMWPLLDHPRFALCVGSIFGKALRAETGEGF